MLVDRIKSIMLLFVLFDITLLWRRNLSSIKKGSKMKRLTCFDVWKMALPYVLLVERVYNTRLSVEYITREALKINSEDASASLTVYIKAGAVCATVTSFENYRTYEWSFLKYASHQAIDDLLRKTILSLGNEIFEAVLLSQD